MQDFLYIITEILNGDIQIPAKFYFAAIGFLTLIFVSVINPIIYFLYIKKIIEKKYKVSLSIPYPVYAALAEWTAPPMELSIYIVGNKISDYFGLKKKSKYYVSCLREILRNEIHYDYKNISFAEKFFAYWELFNLILVFISFAIIFVVDK